MPTAIDYRPLLYPPDPIAVAAFRAAHRADPRYLGSSIGAIFGAAVIGLLALFVFGIVVVPILIGLGAGLGPGGLIPLIAVIGIPLIAAGLITAVVLGGRRRWRRAYRLDSFAAANGLSYSPSSAEPDYPGSIFNLGDSRSSNDHLQRLVGRYLDYGNYSYVTGSGKNRTTHNWGFVAMRLDRALPHIVLDSKANNLLFGASNFPASFAKDQMLSLEGDFDRYFTLYCPKEYERDALYVFTPALMAECIDEAAPFDLEIVDRWLFAYSAKPFEMDSPQVQQRVWRIIDGVGARTLDESDNYADERAGGRAAFAANVVAPQGARLRRRISVATIVIFAIVALAILLPQLISR